MGKVRLYSNLEVEEQELFTPQEKAFQFSGVGDYGKRWYTPIAVQKYGDRPDIVERVNELRMNYLKSIFQTQSIIWEGFPEGETPDPWDMVDVQLMTVNDEAQETDWDPKPVKDELRLKEKYNKKFKIRT